MKCFQSLLSTAPKTCQLAIQNCFEFVAVPGPALQFVTAFMCEKEPWKAKYLRAAFPSVKAIFSDMNELHRGKAHDFLSGTIVKVPKVSGHFFFGFESMATSIFHPCFFGETGETG